ncbi:MAG TPA: GNAT family N-acetyltransferase [Candidatus Manganitrophaceae bacterium]|nr:GNAT family N-acetyltransferase [Candidatus Manganitrophaceae bacterium]
MTSRPTPAPPARVKIERFNGKASERPLTVERIGDERRLADLKEPWERLLLRSSRGNPFLSWGWVAAWRRHFGEGKALEILVIREGEEVVGIAPFYMAVESRLGIPLRRLSILGDEAVGSDHLDLLSLDGFEEKVAGAVAEYWRRSPGRWDFIQLRDLSERSPHLPFLIEAVQKQGGFIQKEEGETCPYLLLGPSWEGALNRLSAGMRYAVRRKIRSVEREGGVEWAAIETWDAGRSGMEALMSLHQQRWRGGSDAFAGPRKIPFHREASQYFFERGIAKLFLLKIEGRIVASLYGFLMGGTFFYYQAGFDPAWGDKSVGTVLMGKTIQSAISRGWKEFDFLRGAEAYKFHWTDDVKKTWDVFFYPPSLKGRIFRRARLMDQELRGFARRRLPPNWLERLRALKMKGFDR